MAINYCVEDFYVFTSKMSTKCQKSREKKVNLIFLLQSFYYIHNILIWRFFSFRLGPYGSRELILHKPLETKDTLAFLIKLAFKRRNAVITLPAKRRLHIRSEYFSYGFIRKIRPQIKIICVPNADL